MGAAMVRRVVQADHQVAVWNRTPDKAQALAESLPIEVCDNAADAVRGRDVVLGVLADGPAHVRCCWTPTCWLRSRLGRWFAISAPAASRRRAN
jgi:3-hydroxyisobutyrate dehydrogenase-like beta-hydroxyacid dehydrogenase